ncbi:DUF58 domain-containing protein [Thioclava atlantica]|uniref:DUF58 domain-containing protein n=1 Tax=Thioclava atlantica TaxID=1317124 RepID=A0A085TYW3_9RHOB|nr:hypothetical protein DW2_04755 [Thioclava atlantica]
MTALPDNPTRALGLRREAEFAASALPPLLVAAEHLAATVQMGAHGRRRAGTGEEFWQYRPAHAGDELRFVDWRRSARSDSQYVREREWQLAQSVHLWVDDAASMSFTGAESGRDARATKSERARLLALALAVLMVRGGERVGLTGMMAPPRPGRAQLMTLAGLLSRDESGQDYGVPQTAGISAQARAVFLSDFLGDLGALEIALGQLADRGVQGVMMQVLDPDEEAFPYDGRTIFQSMAGGLVHETRKAGDLRGRYLERLAERRDRLATMARNAGWQFSTHHTGDPAQAALLWLYSALERGR